MVSRVFGGRDFIVLFYCLIFLDLCEAVLFFLLRFSSHLGSVCLLECRLCQVMQEVDTSRFGGAPF